MNAKFGSKIDLSVKRASGEIENYGEFHNYPLPSFITSNFIKGVTYLGSGVNLEVQSSSDTCILQLSGTFEQNGFTINRVSEAYSFPFDNGLYVFQNGVVGGWRNAGSGASITVSRSNSVSAQTLYRFIPTITGIQETSVTSITAIYSNGSMTLSTTQPKALPVVVSPYTLRTLNFCDSGSPGRGRAIPINPPIDLQIGDAVLINNFTYTFSYPSHTPTTFTTSPLSSLSGSGVFQRTRRITSGDNITANRIFLLTDANKITIPDMLGPSDSLLLPSSYTITETIVASQTSSTNAQVSNDMEESHTVIGITSIGGTIKQIAWGTTTEIFGIIEYDTPVVIPTAKVIRVTMSTKFDPIITLPTSLMDSGIFKTSFSTGSAYGWSLSAYPISGGDIGVISNIVTSDIHYIHNQNFDGVNTIVLSAANNAYGILPDANMVFMGANNTLNGFNVNEYSSTKFGVFGTGEAIPLSSVSDFSSNIFTLWGVLSTFEGTTTTTTTTTTPSPTTSTTTTPSPNINICGAKLILEGGALYNYNLYTNSTNFLGNIIPSNDIAITEDKLWAYSSGIIYEYNINLNPWSISFNRTISGAPSGAIAGMDIKNEFTLIMGGSDIVAVDISRSAAVNNKLFALPLGHIVSGDIYYNPYSDDYYITYENSGGDTFYIGRFLEDGTIVASSLLDISGYPWGIFAYDNDLYVSSSNGGIYSIDSNNLSASLVKNVSLPAQIYGAAQPNICAPSGCEECLPDPLPYTTSAPLPFTSKIPLSIIPKPKLNFEFTNPLTPSFIITTTITTRPVTTTTTTTTTHTTKCPNECGCNKLGF
jgi:hypothetical protein